MKEPKYPKQANEFKCILAESHLTLDELSHRAGINSETMRKYAGGYQECGKARMLAIRQVRDYEVARLKQASGGPTPRTHHDDVVAYAGKLLDLPADKRETVKALIDQLGKKSEREPRKPAPKTERSNPDSPMLLNEVVRATEPRAKPGPSPQKLPPSSDKSSKPVRSGPRSTPRRQFPTEDWELEQ